MLKKLRKKEQAPIVKPKEEELVKFILGTIPNGDIKKVFRSMCRSYLREQHVLSPPQKSAIKIKGRKASSSKDLSVVDDKLREELDFDRVARMNGISYAVLVANPNVSPPQVSVVFEKKDMPFLKKAFAEYLERYKKQNTGIRKPTFEEHMEQMKIKADEHNANVARQRQLQKNNS